ncbi:MAG: 5'/3'-nucleotidase SurE [Bacteroidota bacterium]|nr:5'/3'-nucleotidase SurE [Bacteroidota bacterium]
MHVRAIPTRRQPLILVTNDDGIGQPGMMALTRAMTGLGEVVVVAPALEQSAIAHAITIHGPIRAQSHTFGDGLGHIRALSIEGTPADCMKLALNNLLPRLPDLVVSGINRGANTAINVLYSGTVGAATESSIRGIDSIAFSLCSKRSDEYDAAARYAGEIASKVLRSRLPRGIVLNVNVPDLPYDEIKGVRVTRLAHSRWTEDFIERMDPNSRPYYWYQGTFENRDTGTDTDVYAISEGYVSMTPIQYDLTAHGCLGVLRTWQWTEPA